MSCRSCGGCSGTTTYHPSTPVNKDQVSTKVFRTNSADALLYKDSYQLAVLAGFKGTLTEWLKSLKGKSAYEIALDNGFIGTEEEWINSLTPKSISELFQDDSFIDELDKWINGRTSQLLKWTKVEW